MLEPLQAFLSHVVALVMAVVALGGGTIVLLRRRSDPRSLRWCLVAVGYAALLIGVTAVTVARTSHLPPINDISTNLEEPPRFPPGSVPAEAGARSYPEEFAERQKAAYPMVRPIRVAFEPRVALSRARATAQQLGWRVNRVDADAGWLLATERSTWFRFVDDIVVRVRPGTGGSIIDVRSRSRGGRGDLGANASRIRRFARAFSAS